jgi:hypothetical protein
LSVTPIAAGLPSLGGGVAIALGQEDMGKPAEHPSARAK